MKTRLTRIFVDFFEREQASGIILILCTLASIAIANSDFGPDCIDLLHRKVGFETGGISLKISIDHWINDGLMAIFFLMIGLEIERELYIGELSDLKNAMLPIFAAIGGMVTPSLIHYALNRGTVTQAGVGIPMATDIAFALGILVFLGKKVPISLKIFLAALAIIDDLGAVIIIALFYSGNLSVVYLCLAAGVYILLLIMNRLGVRLLSVYIIFGVVIWYLMLRSGVHATIAGVLLAFAIPFSSGDENSPSTRLQHSLHRPVAFIIMPLFALANAGILLNSNWVETLATPNSMGILAGLLVGKPLGIFLFCLVAVRLGLSELPGDLTWRHVIGAGFLGGIGFTMSIFITLLAFDKPEIIQSSKISILLGSFASGVIGFMILKRESKFTPEN